VHNVSRDRLTAFTDAAVAIALTLLVLPLVDAVHEFGGALSELLHQYGRAFLAFVLSFWVIARFWRVHRRLFETVSNVDEVTVNLNIAWLFGIVFLPVPTAVLVVEKGTGAGASALYATNLVYVSLTAIVLALWVMWHPQLWAEDTDRRTLAPFVWRGGATVVVMALAIPFAFLWGENALLLLLLMIPAQRLADHISRRWTATS
jgi:uncharacterized membrane protein